MPGGRIDPKVWLNPPATRTNKIMLLNAQTVMCTLPHTGPIGEDAAGTCMMWLIGAESSQVVAVLYHDLAVSESTLMLDRAADLGPLSRYSQLDRVSEAPCSRSFLDPSWGSRRNCPQWCCFISTRTPLSPPTALPPVNNQYFSVQYVRVYCPTLKIY